MTECSTPHSRNVLTSKRLNVRILTMAEPQKRSTIYLEPDLHRAVKLKSAHTNRTISDIVNESLRAALREDEEDLAAFDLRGSEPVISYEALLAKLKADGKI